jgi:hypothetical protein
MEVARGLVGLGNDKDAIAVLLKAGRLAAEGQSAGALECAKILAEVSVHLSDLGSQKAVRIARSIDSRQLRDETLNRLRNRRRGYLGRGVPE